MQEFRIIETPEASLAPSAVWKHWKEHILLDHRTYYGEPHIFYPDAQIRIRNRYLRVSLGIDHHIVAAGRLRGLDTRYVSAGCKSLRFFFY